MDDFTTRCIMQFLQEIRGNLPTSIMSRKLGESALNMNHLFLPVDLVALYLL